MGHELRTAKDNSHLCVNTAVFLPCVSRVLLVQVGKAHVSAAGRSLRECRLGANALQSGSDFFYTVCALALTLQLLLKSAQLIAGPERHPILLAPLQPTHVCTPRTFLPPSLGTLYAKDFSSIQFSACFEATVPSVFHSLTTSYRLWKGGLLKYFLGANLSWAPPQANNLVPVRKAISLATALTRRMTRGNSWARRPPWAGPPWSHSRGPREESLTVTQTFPFTGGICFLSQPVTQSRFEDHRCWQKDTPIQAITKVQTVPLARCWYANNTRIDPVILFPSVVYQD